MRTVSCLGGECIRNTFVGNNAPEIYLQFMEYKSLCSKPH